MTDRSSSAKTVTRKRLGWFTPPKIVRRFGNENDGATAIEFGMLAVPFFMLFMAIIESSLLFFANELLESAVDNVGRQIRTGQLDDTMTEAELRAAICEEASLIFSSGTDEEGNPLCSELNIDLQTVATFDDLGAFPKPEDGELDPDDYGYTAPNCQQIVMLTASYEWPIYTNYMQKHLSNLANGKALINAIAVFRTEPYC